MEAFHEFTRILAVALGIGLVIFVHELGHFIAARWCKVRVEVFSIGFGPAIFSWRRGETLYQLGLIPLGGYVKMAGDEGVSEGAEPQDWQLPSKSVGQRFFIYSGGVLMNVLFATLIFPVLFAVGVPFHQPLLGESQPGSPAWQAGLGAGTRVLSVNGDEVYDFGHIPTAVALGEGTVELEVLAPGAEVPETLVLKSEYNDNLDFESIGVTLGLDPEGSLNVAEGSAAWDAGLRPEDRLIGFPEAPAQMDLETQLYVMRDRGLPLVMDIEGPNGPRQITVNPRPMELGAPRMGIQPPPRHVIALRDTPLVRELGLEVDDRVTSVDGLPVWRVGDFWLHLAASEGVHEIVIERDEEFQVLTTPPLSTSEAARLARDVAMVSDRESTVLVIEPGSPAALAGLVNGDRVTQIGGTAANDWADVRDRVREAALVGEGVELTLERIGPEGEISYLKPQITPQTVAIPDYGFALKGASYVYSVDNPIDAMRIGVACSWKLVQDSWFMLKGIIGGRVSGKHMGGIITIGAVSYELSGSGWAKLLFFLCLLSVNVAFINVLPIPVLDGGHLFFLLVEKLKGSPVSERVLGYSQMVGLVLILSLMVYVTFNDIARWFLNS